jgi:hypothetical protein
MPQPSLTDRQRTLVRDLVQLVETRAVAEPAIDDSARARKEAAQREFDDDYQTVIVRFAAAKDSAEREVESARAAVRSAHEEEKRSAESDLDVSRRKVRGRYAKEKHKTKTAYQEGRWTLAAMMEARKTEVEGRFKEVENRVASILSRLDAIRQEVQTLLAKWRMPPEFADGSLLDPSGSQSTIQLRKLPDCLPEAEGHLAGLKALILPRYSKGWRLPVMFLLLWLASAYPVSLLIGWPVGLAVSGFGAAVVGVLTEALLSSLARARVLKICMPLCQVLADAEPAARRVLARCTTVCQNEIVRARRRINRKLRNAFRAYKRERAASKRRREDGLREAQEDCERRLAANEWRRVDGLRQAETSYQSRRTDIQERYDTDARQLRERHQRQMEEIDARQERERQELADNWRRSLADARATIAAIHDQTGRHFPAWDDPSWSAWTAPCELPSGVRFGEFRVSLGARLNGAPAQMVVGLRGGEVVKEADDATVSLPHHLATSSPRHFAPALADFSLPALFPFPGGSLLIQASEEGRTPAVDVLQTLMFRLLTTIPPGKARFTICDPVGLGQNFAAFMHLADYDEALVTNRIWTEQAHIEQRLADLTAHMENVIQKYLRNQFETIEAYNAEAGEVAEPFRFLVVANFPANFSVEAARRLVSIAQSGPRCGVYTLLTVDTKQPLPVGFDLGDLERGAVNLFWQDRRFVWQDIDYGDYPLTLDASPPDDLSMRVLHQVGDKARDAKRVEVPFEFIAPPPEQWWAADSRAGLDVPLGRAGATKRQHLRLGQGTAQHVLVAGKTGSGKSTLLHALVTNLSLLYSPEEVELYLVDFKKGVEFKTYAAHELPHARVVAIESEREFGLSVLQRLDAELKLRGDRFREAGAQDINAYRQAVGSRQSAVGSRQGAEGSGQGAVGSEQSTSVSTADCPLPTATVMPRILLIVDEFQEFFVEDDRIAQEAAQLLDRLVRQGRAFGLHVLLGSQTLGGAYSLARSTIDQMAVRIALQCSEADAHLILSDGNGAARLLSRPGEAIYNDANGLVEGNNPFQVVWLADDRREDYLLRVRERARQRQRWLAPPLVFEGNRPADPSRNVALHELLHASTWPAAPRAVYAWLGDAVAIKDPTAATFRQQNGSNLLIVGQHDEAALGTLATALIGLAAQLAPSAASGLAPPRFYVVDGGQPDAPHAGLLGRVTGALPHSASVAGWRGVPAVMAELTDELERRQHRPDAQAAPLFMILFGLQRFRDLRRADDDYGFSRRGGERPSPAQQFAALLREGAGLGIHTLIWCDTLNNLQRTLDRQSLREFEMRVVFQMSVADSSNLIDSPLAAKLGLHRALFHSEEQGRLEKFRPYGVPTEEWLAEVKERLHGRSMASSGL